MFWHISVNCFRRFRSWAHHPTPRPSGTIKATDIRNPLKARSTLAETSSYNSSVCGPAIRPPVTYENGGRNTGSVKPKFGAASLTDNGTRNRMEGCPNTVSPRMTEPTLCKRGSFRQDYAGSTLRDHSPVNVFSRSLQAIASSIEDRSRRARRAVLCSASEQFVRSPTHSGFAAIESDQFASLKCQPCFREQQESAAIEHIWRSLDQQPRTRSDASMSTQLRHRILRHTGCDVPESSPPESNSPIMDQPQSPTANRVSVI